MHVAIDGSILIDEPYSPAGLHLIEWLSLLHGAGFQVTLLHPQGNLPPIPREIGTVSIRRGGGVVGSLLFGQRDLPRVAGDLPADLLLVGEGRAPLACPTPFVTISSLSGGRRSPGLSEAILSAAGRAGSGGATIRLTPSDVDLQSGRRVHPPFVAPAFGRPVEQGGDEHVVCYGFNRADVDFILAAWTFVDGSLADTYPLVLLGVSEPLIGGIKRRAADLDVVDSIRIEPKISYLDLPGIYGRAAAYLGTEFTAEGQAIRWALSAGAPVVGLKTNPFESLLGRAAYLVPPGDSRGLGAALLTVLVQERVSKPLRDEGFKQAAKYLDPHAGEEIAVLLRKTRNLARGAIEHDE